MEEVFQNGNYQREANANMTAMETRKEVKGLGLFFTCIRLSRQIDKSLSHRGPPFRSRVASLVTAELRDSGISERTAQPSASWIDRRRDAD